MDPHHFVANPDADSDSTYRPDADPIVHPDADPDPDPSFKNRLKPLKKLYSIHFGLKSANRCGSGSRSGYSLQILTHVSDNVSYRFY